MSQQKSVITFHDLLYDKKYSQNLKPTPYAFSELCCVPPNTVYRLLDAGLIFVDGMPFVPLSYKSSQNKTDVVVAARDRISDYLLFEEL